MRTLILMCNRDDDSGEMGAMAERIAMSLRERGHEVQVVDLGVLKFETLDFEQFGLPKLATRVAALGRWDEVVFTGHSRCFEAESVFRDKRYVIRPLAERRVGGYTSLELAATVMVAAQKTGAQRFMFCACEVASTVANHELVQPAEELEQAFPADPPGHVGAIAPHRVDAEISLLFDIAANILALMKASHYYDPIVVKGLNGVGCIDSADYRTFSSEHHTRYETEVGRAANKHARPTNHEFYTTCVEQKTSPHVIMFTVVNDGA